MVGIKILFYFWERLWGLWRWKIKYQDTLLFFDETMGLLALEIKYQDTLLFFDETIGLPVLEIKYQDTKTSCENLKISKNSAYFH